MKNNKKDEKKSLVLITIVILILITIALIIFGVLLPNFNKENGTENENFVSNQEVDGDNIFKPSQEEWKTLQLSR